MIPPADPCPCDSGAAFGECCRPAIAGDTPPPTAEACMRARYTAYTLGETDYIISTIHTSTRGEASRENIDQWSREAEWLGLEILGTDSGGPDDEEGTVSFVARYKQHGENVDHVEHAYFKREDGDWRFLTASTPPFKREKRKVGRNEPCPCESGKKYKKCCGKAA